MKKRTIGILAGVLCLVVAGASFAAGWLASTKGDTNTVTIGQAMTVSISGTGADATIYPGESKKVDFTVVDLDAAKVAHSDKTFTLAITDIDFEEEDITVWSWRLGTTGEFTAFADTDAITIQSAPANGALELYIKLADLNAETPAELALAGTALTFKIAIVIA